MEFDVSLVLSYWVRSETSLRMFFLGFILKCMAVLMIGSIFCDLLVKLTVRYFPRELVFFISFLEHIADALH